MLIKKEGRSEGRNKPSYNYEKMIIVILKVDDGMEEGQRKIAKKMGYSQPKSKKRIMDKH